MKQLRMENGDIVDATDAERCPECGKPITHTEQRGDVTAFVHVDDTRNDCLR